MFADDAVVAGAALDRLLHRSTVINIRSLSPRMRGKKRAGVVPEVEPKGSAV